MTEPTVLPAFCADCERDLASMARVGVPEHLRYGIARYVSHGVSPGGFLCAVIDNNLSRAIGNGDDVSRAAIVEIVGWFYNEAPRGCWGDAKRHKAWNAMRRAEPKCALVRS